MINVKKIYDAESVYLCTMCDGPMNHFHIQLITRYSFEQRGSTNFVKPRFEYKEDLEKIEKLRELMRWKEICTVEFTAIAKYSYYIPYP